MKVVREHGQRTAGRKGFYDVFNRFHDVAVFEISESTGSAQHHW
jgi:hypothetical protein